MSDAEEQAVEELSPKMERPKSLLVLSGWPRLRWEFWWEGAYGIELNREWDAEQQ